MNNQAILDTMARQIAEEERLMEIAKLYPKQGYIAKERSRGWRTSKWREVASK